MNNLPTYYRSMPKAVRVGCFQFKVTMGAIEHDMTSSFGFMAPSMKLISVAPNMSAQELANTFMHEVIHAIHHVYGLMRHPEDPQPSEEEYTNLTANGLCAFFQDNPQACAWWMKTLRAEGE